MAGMRIVETTKAKERQAVVPRTEGKSDFSTLPQPQWFTIVTNAQGEMLDDNGAVTNDRNKAAKKWRSTRFPDPQPGETPHNWAVMLHPDTSPRGLHQITCMGETIPRFFDPPDPTNPRHRQQFVKIMTATDSQIEAFRQRLAEEWIEADSEWAVDEDTQKLEKIRDGGPVCKAKIVVIEKIPAEMGVQQMMPGEGTLRMLEQWKTRMGETATGEAPELVTKDQQEAALSNLLYAMQIAEPNDTRTPEEILRDLVNRAAANDPENPGPVDSGGNGKKKPKDK